MGRGHVPTMQPAVLPLKAHKAAQNSVNVVVTLCMYAVCCIMRGF